MSLPSASPDNTGVARPITVAIGRDQLGWDERLLDAFRLLGHNTASIVNLDAHDWLQRVGDAQVVVWKPSIMGPVAAAQFRTKVYFLESHLHKIVVPNVASTWHFENKIAQQYLLESVGAPMPRSVSSFDFHDAVAQLATTTFPIVVKEADGAGSSKVRMIHSRAEAEVYLETRFCQQFWEEAKRRTGSARKAYLASLTKRWFRHKLLANARGDERFRSVYWQEYVPGNSGDLRVAVIGDRYAYWFRRENRPGDFRASGSGRIRYDENPPLDIVEYCSRLNAQLGFDSMAYDVVFRGDQFVIIEMSFGYLDTAPYNAPGYLRRAESGSWELVRGHVWPQKLWAEWTLHRARAAVHSSAVSV